MIRFRPTTYIFSFLLLIAVVPGIAEAAKVKVTPRVIDLEVKQRDIITRIITVENTAEHKIDAYASVNAISVDENGDFAPFVPPSMADNTVTVTSWLQISRKVIELHPGESIELPLTIKVDPNAVGGVYHAFIGFGTGTNRDISEAQIHAGTGTGVLVTLKVDQEQTEFLKLGGFAVDRFVISTDNSAIHYTLSNPGSAAVVPRGEVILSNSRGEEVGAVEINPGSDSLAPGESKQYEAAVPTSGLLGKYKAFLSVDYGTDQLASVYDTAFFYIIPWKQLLAIFIGILIAVIILTLFFHRRYADDDIDDEHGAEYLPLYVREGQSNETEHDINLKQK